MSVGKHKIKSHMTLAYDFTGMRLQDGCFTPVSWELKVNLIAPSNTSKKLKDELELRSGIAYNRMYFWLETNLSSVIMVDVTNKDDLYLSNLSTNITLYCPGDVNDDHLIQLLHAKLNALAGDALIVGEMTLKGDDTSVMYTFDCANEQYELPTDVLTYIERESRDTTPWWYRDDGFCFEFVKPTQEEGEEPIPDNIFEDIVDPMTEFEKILQEATESYIGIIKEPARIVQIEKWKPKTV